jgi:Cysteine synthase
MTLPAPVIRKHDGFLVVRDDMLEGGTKRRVLGSLLARWPNNEFVYASMSGGYGPVALAYACRDLGRRATLIYSWHKSKPLVEKAKAAGADIVMTPKPAFFNVVQKHARNYAQAHPEARLLKMGFDYPEFVEETAELAGSLDVQPQQVWCAGGSGALTRALQKAWPGAEHHVVRVSSVRGDFGRATQHMAPEKFTQVAKIKPPFPSAKYYDAKIWRFVEELAEPGALVWNVGA